MAIGTLGDGQGWIHTAYRQSGTQIKMWGLKPFETLVSEILPAPSS